MEMNGNKLIIKMDKIPKRLNIKRWSLQNPVVFAFNINLSHYNSY